MSEKLSQRAREEIKALGEFTLDDIGLRLAIKTYRERKVVSDTVSRLKSQGEVVLIKPGLYRFEGKETLSVTEKIWRAMMIKAQFTKSELMKLTSASRCHLKNYLRFLIKAGFVKRVHAQGAKATIYCLVDSDKAPLSHPRMSKRRKK